MPKIHILLHSSKTMVSTNERHIMSQPQFSEQADELRSYIATLSLEDISKYMKVSLTKAKTIHEIYTNKHALSPAAECFRGDIYSGLRALDFTKTEREFAQKHLIILSGLYGTL